MSTIALNYPNVPRVRHTSAIGLILIITSLALLTSAILSIVFSANRDINPTDAILTWQNSVIPIPVPTPPNAVIQPIPSQTPAHLSASTSEPAIVPVLVPTPPALAVPNSEIVVQTNHAHRILQENT